MTTPHPHHVAALPAQLVDQVCCRLCGTTVTHNPSYPGGFTCGCLLPPWVLNLLTDEQCERFLAWSIELDNQKVGDDEFQPSPDQLRTMVQRIRQEASE